MYTPADLVKLRQAATKLCQKLTSDLFGKEDKIDSSTIIPAPEILKDFLHSLSSVRARLWPEAGIEMKQINEEGAR